MAREKHIVDLTIGNFKRFADFEVKNLGQFNLIVGDNNTGKTSFLEALIFDEEESVFELIKNLASSFHVRSQEISDLGLKEHVYNNFSLFLNRNFISENLNIFYAKANGTYVMSLRRFSHNEDLGNLNSFEKEKLYSSDDTINEFIFSVNNTISTTLSPIPSIKDYYPFVAFGLGYDDHLIKYYSKYIDVNKATRNLFIERLQVLIPKVNDVRVGNDVLNIYEEGIDTPMPLFTYGEGANKLFRILCEIAMCKGKRLMIDEIDAGIHYSRFKSFWRTIMQAAKAYDVQIFATTHNIECVEYFREVLEEEAMQEYQDLARIVSLKVKEDNSVKARVYDYEYMEYAKDANRELRGGGL
ncbi:MAG: DNA helicase [uncultured Aureispira sp.]|uniref:DNA helicase n=1 Tax=uncultured Aureispira sp. TaxID=1331704 RepID=A0A6S6SUK6_9BACT|nr:MAG: DNA helicase [uncultured Aureispira sp.]